MDPSGQVEASQEPSRARKDAVLAPETRPLSYGRGSDRGSSWFPPVALFFIVLWLVLLGVGRERMLRDPGTLWHTVVGEQMLRSGRLVCTDTFSFTFDGQPWIAQQWLGEIVMAGVHRLAGLDGLLLAAVTVLAAVYASLAGRFLRAGVVWPAVALLITLILAASSYHFHPRPHLATIALLAWTLGLLCDVEAGRRPARRLLLLPAVFVLWTNVHGGALAGIGTTLLVLGAWFMRWVFASDALRLKPEAAITPASASFRPGRSLRIASPAILWVVAALSALAVGVNPYGIDLPRVWFKLMRSGVLPTIMIEHAPLEVFSVEGAMVGMLAGLYLTVLVSTLRHLQRVSRLSGDAVAWRATWLVPILWLIAAVMRVRHGPLFAVTAAIAIADMLPHSPIPAWFSSRGSQLFSPVNPAAPSGPRAFVVPAMLVALAFALQAGGVRCPLIGAGWARLPENRWPVAATEVLREHLSLGRVVPGTPPSSLVDRRESRPHVFNDLGYGGYLVYYLPEVALFIDDRCELYGDAFLLEYIDILKNPGLIEKVADRYDVAVALIRSRSRLDRYLDNSPAWASLYRDTTAAIYHRLAKRRLGAPPLPEVEDTGTQ